MFHARGPAVEVHAVNETPRVSEVLARGAHPLRYVFMPRSLSDAAPAVKASLADVPIRLTPATQWPTGVLESLVEHFLHDPALEVPIEPFATLARTIAGMGAETLWDAYHERLGRDFFLDAKGRVSLSERQARAGRFLGKIEDTVETFEASDLWRSLAQLRETVFATPTACATCAHFPACGGFWLANEQDDREICRVWRAAMRQLTGAWRAHRDAAPTRPSVTEEDSPSAKTM